MYDNVNKLYNFSTSIHNDSLSNMSTHVPIDPVSFDDTKDTQNITLSVENFKTFNKIEESTHHEPNNKTENLNLRSKENAQEKVYRRRPVVLVSVDKLTGNLTLHRESLQIFESAPEESYTVVGIIGSKNSTQLVNFLFSLPLPGFSQYDEIENFDQKLWLWGQPIKLVSSYGVTKHILLLFLDLNYLFQKKPEDNIFSIFLSISSFLIFIAHFADTTTLARSFSDIARKAVADIHYKTSNNKNILWIATNTLFEDENSKKLSFILENERILEIENFLGKALLFSECKASTLPCCDHITYSDYVSNLSQKLVQKLFDISLCGNNILLASDFLNRIYDRINFFNKLNNKKEISEAQIDKTSLVLPEYEKPEGSAKQLTKAIKLSPETDTITDQCEKNTLLSNDESLTSVMSNEKNAKQSPRDIELCSKEVLPLHKSIDNDFIYSEYLQAVTNSIKNVTDSFFDENSQKQTKIENFRKILTEAIPSITEYPLTQIYLKKILILVSMPFEKILNNANKLSFENLCLNDEINRLNNLVNDLQKEAGTRTDLTYQSSKDNNLTEKLKFSNEKPSTMEKMMGFCYPPKQTRNSNINEKLNIALNELQVVKSYLTDHYEIHNKEQILQLQQDLEKTKKTLSLLQERYETEQKNFESYRKTTDAEILNLTDQLIEFQKKLVPTK